MCFCVYVCVLFLHRFIFDGCFFTCHQIAVRVSTNFASIVYILVTRVLCTILTTFKKLFAGSETMKLITFESLEMNVKCIRIKNSIIDSDYWDWIVSLYIVIDGCFEWKIISHNVTFRSNSIESNKKLSSTYTHTVNWSDLMFIALIWIPFFCLFFERVSTPMHYCLR